MTAKFDIAEATRRFTPRLVEGAPNALRVVFLDPVVEISGGVAGAIIQALHSDGEAVFAINRYAICEGYRRIGKACPLVALPEYGAPDAIRAIDLPLHSVFAAALPPAWVTGQVRSYALSSPEPTIGLGIQAHKWLVELGPSASNRLLWSENAS